MTGVKLLVLGGSWFVGRAIVGEALHRGWAVTTFRRGLSPGLPGVREIFGDWEHRGDLESLAAQGPWDVVVDVAGSVPLLVRNTTRALRSRAGLYVFISTVSAYRDWPHRPVDESSPLFDGDPDLDPRTRVWDPDAYGPLKAGCELAVLREYGDRR
jgi:nucleoside-diphosphate-sugar epimerase